LTPEFRVAKAIIVRPEYRHDWSDKKIFNSNTRKTQDTIALGVMYTWLGAIQIRDLVKDQKEVPDMSGTRK
jgi:hypothetical protein